MVQNSSEYGILEAYGEDFEDLKAGPYVLDFHAIVYLMNPLSLRSGRHYVTNSEAMLY